MTAFDASTTTTRAALLELLDRGLDYAPTYGAALANHLPMALIALERLGADAERLRAFSARYCTRLERRGAPAPVVDVEQTVRQLKDGIGASAFHGVIRLAYALESEFTPEVHAALDAWQRSYLPVGHTTHLPHDLVIPAVDAPNIHERMKKVAAHPRFLAALSRDGELNDDALCDFCVSTFARSGGNFTALHTVTALHAFYVVDDHYPLDREALGAALLAAAATVPPAKSPMPLPNDVHSWDALYAAARPSPDDHTLKLTYSCRALMERTGDRRFAQVAQHRLEAQRLL